MAIALQILTSSTAEGSEVGLLEALEGLRIIAVAIITIVETVIEEVWIVSGLGTVLWGRVR